MSKCVDTFAGALRDVANCFPQDTQAPAMTMELVTIKSTIANTGAVHVAEEYLHSLQAPALVLPKCYFTCVALGSVQQT